MIDKDQLGGLRGGITCRLTSGTTYQAEGETRNYETASVPQFVFVGGSSAKNIGARGMRT